MEQITVTSRDSAAKAKQLRRHGIIPCVIYGAALRSSISAQLDKDNAKQLLRTKRTGSSVDLRYEGRTIHALIKALERSCVGGEVIHVSFQAMEADRKVTGRAQIHLLNKDTLPGVLEQSQFEVTYTALPADLFDTVTIDLADLPVGTVVSVSDLPQLQNEHIELLTPADSVIFKIVDKTRG